MVALKAAAKSKNPHTRILSNAPLQALRRCAAARGSLSAGDLSRTIPREFSVWIQFKPAPESAGLGPALSGAVY